jgi:hypothetical protein
VAQSIGRVGWYHQFGRVAAQIRKLLQKKRPPAATFDLPNAHSFVSFSTTFFLKFDFYNLKSRKRLAFLTKTMNVFFLVD